MNLQRSKNLSKGYRGGLARFFLIVCAVVFLYGCGQIRIGDILDSARTNPHDGAFIEGVEFFPQKSFMCGPSALTSILNYYRVAIEEEEVEKAVFKEKLKGALTMDILIYAREKGLKAEYYNGSLDDLKKRIKDGAPLILFLNLGYESYPIGHYIVAVGYSDRYESVVAHWGDEKEKVISYKKLLNYWEKTNFATILIRPE